MFFDDSRPDRRKRADKREGVNRHMRLTSSLIPAPKQYELLTVDELFSGKPRTFIFDTECYKNYWLAAFKCAETGKIIFFEVSPETGLNANLLGFIMHRFLIVGFNSISYDMPMIALALHGLAPWKLKQISDEIIKEGKRPYQIERDYGVRIPDSNHIDLIEVAPIEASLKIYAGRLHCERMQDLPYSEDSELQRHEAMIVRDYCINDLDNTHLLYDHLKPHLELRNIIGKEYGVDLRSKSDAQVAEAIIGIELERAGAEIGKPTIGPGDTFFYDVPEYVSFKTPQFQQALDVVRSTPFVVGNSGSAECPPAIAVLKPRLGSGTYRLGVGGLHSSEENTAHFADPDTLIIDRDVASYYPYIILNNKLFPPHIGAIFLEIYRAIVMRRLKLKKMKDPLEAGLKIAINGIFGKLGNLFSKVYAPHLLLQVCMTGQLCLMMLIEALELAGIPVVSANTDGIVIKCPKHRYKDLETVIMVWENLTGFSTEETRYEGIFSRDVNNYIAVKTEYHVDEATKEVVWHDGVRGELKTKGVYCERGSAQNSVLSKNPEAYICSMAVQEFLAKNVPVADTIVNCKDVKRFVSVRTVKGGGEKDGIYLGKAIRWYYAQDERGTINYVVSGNKVPKSEGAKPLMIMPPGHIPNDIDYDHYVNMANEILFDIGYFKRATNPTLF
jgi:hypothetical protein